MGAKGKNFHANVAIRMGYERDGRRGPGPLPGRQEGRGGAPRSRSELIEQLSLIGPEDKIRDDLEAWRESIVTTLLIAGDVGTLRTAAELVLG